MDTNRYDLTQGSILDKLLLIAAPVMGSSFMQMAYNLTNMFWLGRMSSNAVAASGTAGMYLWLSTAFMLLCRTGAEIGISQSTGRGELDKAMAYARTTLTLALVSGTIYSLLLFFFNGPLIGFFNISDPSVVTDARTYLKIVGIGVPFNCVGVTINGIFNGRGNSRLPFIINAVGLLINIVLDPLLIQGAGWGVLGAAIATVIAQAVVAALFCLCLIKSSQRPFPSFQFRFVMHRDELRQVLRWCIPVAIDNMLFALLTMITARMIAGFGPNAIAVQRVCSQIESLTWLLAGGYGTALTAYVGQNYGARRWDRIDKGFTVSIQVMSLWGILVSLALYFGGGAMFSIFLPQDPRIVGMGVVYLQILAVSQVGACMEYVAGGLFRGFGKTLPPFLSSTVFNIIRVPLAWYLSQTALGLNGIWWSISITTLGRGALALLWYLLRSPTRAARLAATQPDTPELVTP